MKNNQKGFTLLETILTLVILSVGIFGAMLTTQNAAANSVSDDCKTIALFLANEKMEEIISDKAFKGYQYVLTNDYSSDSNSGYTKSISIQEVQAQDLTTSSSGSGYMKVVVSVAWGTKNYEKVQIATLLTEISN